MYEGEEFEVPEVAGLVVRELVGFTEGPDDEHPEKLVMTTDDQRRFAFYLGAFRGSCDLVDSEAYAELRADFAAAREVNYGERFGLRGARIIDARCLQGPTGAELRVRLDRGELRLAAVDGSDPHSDSQLSFTVVDQR